MNATRPARDTARMDIRKPPPLERDDEMPQIDTPVIDMQDLEHQQIPEIRVSNAGIEVLPQIDVPKEDKEL